MKSFLERTQNLLGNLFIRLTTRPKVINPQLLLPTPGSGQQVFYVLESDRWSHRLLLQSLLEKQQRKVEPAQILLSDSGGVAPLRETLADLLRTQENNPSLHIQIIPVAIFHGRLPGREDSWLNLLYAETWHKAGPLGSALQLLVNGRHTLIRVDKALELPQLLSTEENIETAARKGARILRTHFAIIRRSIIGPDLSHRRNFISLVLNNPDVQEAIDQQAKRTGESRYRIERHCLKTLDKIAADFSPVTARLLFPIFNWVWKRLYNQIRVCNVEGVHEIAKTHHLIYLPCHRSHMDYLLFSWSLYQQGLGIPHVAAGENLNIPIIGPILKRCGAIFMRRSFKGDPLYASLYKSYLEQMSHRGHPLEYFIEGGRSRTGRLLPAKTGLLSMNVQSFMENPNQPVALVPVWIGYDRLVESHSYQQELSGNGKKQESINDFFSSLSILREKFGDTYLSFGKPIDLTTVTHNCHDKAVSTAANMALCNINSAACLPRSSLLGTVLLAGFKPQSVAELSSKCSALLNLLNSLEQHSGFSPSGNPSVWIEEAAAMGQLELQRNQVILSQQQASELCFYRNNIQHLLILPGLYLLLAHRLENAKAQRINRAVRALYPFMQAELFLPWQERELTQVLKKTREQLLQQNLLENGDGHSWQISSHPLCSTLILTVEPILLRYYIVLRVLNRYQQISHEDLLASTQKIAEKIHAEYGYSSKEYQDKAVIQTFVEQLQGIEMISSERGRWLAHSDTHEAITQMEAILRPHMISLINQQLLH